MYKFKNVNVVLYNGTYFKPGDIVTVVTFRTGNEYTGRISSIGGNNLRLDMSKEYESIQRDFEFENISKIELVKLDVQYAASIIQKVFSDKDSGMYKALVESIASALKELPKETGLYDAAERIVDRIIGL